MNNSVHRAPTIESARLSMRTLSRDDEAFYCSLYMDAEVMRFVGAPLSKDSAVEGFRKTLELMERPGGFERRVLVLLDRATQQPVGISSIRMLDGKRGRAEVGTLLKPGAHDKGFAWECSTALITQAFTRPQVHELVAHCAPDNTGVDRLLADLGFVRGKAVPAGHGRSARVAWSLTRGAWEKQRRAAEKSE